MALIILLIMPYSTVLSLFSPYETAHTFQEFLIASVVFAIVSLLLAWALASNSLFKNKGFLFFLLGMLVAPPLMLGIPETSPKLLERVTEEHFRYGLLMLATFVYTIGFLVLLRKIWKELSVTDKLIIIPFVISVVLMFWDNYSSYHFSSQLADWIASGNKVEDFFPNYDFQELYRTLGRSMIYISVPWLSYILFKKQELKKWQMIFLSIFSIFGVAFFFLFNFINFQFYFPFMVPAIALAPAYWLGLMLMLRK